MSNLVVHVMMHQNKVREAMHSVFNLSLLKVRKVNPFLEKYELSKWREDFLYAENVFLFKEEKKEEWIELQERITH